jgi:hypothetical protein
MDIREEIISALEREVVGPAPIPNYKDSATGEEILLARVHGSPKSRYGAGMLYPKASPNLGSTDSGNEAKIQDIDIEVTSLEEVGSIEVEGKSRKDSTENGAADEEPVGLANNFFPSAMGFTVRLKKGLTNNKIKILVNSAYYEKGTDEKPVKKVNNSGEIEDATYKPRNKNGEDGTGAEQVFMSDYWVRRPLKIDPVEIKLDDLFSGNNKSYSKVIQKSEQRDWLKLQIFNRSTAEDKKEDFYTLTFVIINEMSASTDSYVSDKYILFQNELELIVENPDLIAPYKEKLSFTDTDEEKELNLLYRNKRIFAIGHGTAVTWNKELGSRTEKVTNIKTSVIPVYDMPQVAPAGDVELSMLQLSDEGNWPEAKTSLSNLVTEYERWIEGIKAEANTVELEPYREAALKNIEKCETTLQRIKRGVQYLAEADESSDLVKCFRWMNRAMIWQQQRSKAKQRKWERRGVGANITYVLEGVNGSNEDTFASLDDYHAASRYNGRWRPFQLAFILMNIESVVKPSSEEREIVDLIWFPTGGGKTEAYLGLTAFTIFYRRFKGKQKGNYGLYSGTTVLMRYTLRLLTTQQYERAASLICACDLIRSENKLELGIEPISIGLWVGSGSTPNKHNDGTDTSAVAQFNNLCNNNNAPYNFIVMKCPCCGAQIGKVSGPTHQVKIKGLKKEDGREGKVVFECENTSCEYIGQPLPLQVVDEYLYDTPPTLLLGTVDKFAMIPWKKEAGHFFGFREEEGEWSRITPPELIIQDELHLIAGPLGTMVGLYETMVQTLCNNYGLRAAPFLPSEDAAFIAPKIVASSATISRAQEQVKGLYGTDKLNIFPSQGLEFGNTWFSELKEISAEHPGRKYVGVLASGYPSAQTAIVRTYSAILQRIKELEDEDHIDYYWTLLGYFNSIRELGGVSSLIHGDIRERLSQIQNRELINWGKRRNRIRHEELTSRIEAHEIPDTLKKLETKFNTTGNRALDTCVATNMVATGVDISRLGLMVVHGQPKTTAEYIQASSRVGRDVPKGPGLVITLYSPSKPRDKSQYEQFQGYHSRIYSNVEPTSITPFSINARQRGLHAVLIGMIRHFSADSLRESAITGSTDFEDLAEKVYSKLIKRCSVVDADEVNNTDRELKRIIAFWKGKFHDYGDAFNAGIRFHNVVPLMYATGTEISEVIKVEKKSLGTPTSMRGVDTESRVSLFTGNNNE